MPLSALMPAPVSTNTRVPLRTGIGEKAVPGATLGSGIIADMVFRQSGLRKAARAARSCSHARPGPAPGAVPAVLHPQPHRADGGAAHRVRCLRLDAPRVADAAPRAR